MANTPQYLTPTVPTAGATPPTVAQARIHSKLAAIITGDGAATTISLTHNWGLNAAQLASNWPEVAYEQLLAAGYTAAPIITAKSANAVTFSCTAFTGAGLKIVLNKPATLTQ